MLHPALSRALITAHVEDLYRAATSRQTIRLPQGGPKPRERTPRERQTGVRRK